MKIAVVGGGIAGLAAARELSRFADVTLYEAERRLGGHTNTVDVAVDGLRFAVDTGFLVFNERTYPNLIRLFNELAVPTTPSDMSFAVSVPLAGGRRLEWAGTSLATTFAQRRNLLSPRFLGMLADIVRFNREATAVAQQPMWAEPVTLGDYLDRNRYGSAFRRWYLLPMAAAIWSCPVRAMLDYPLATFARFCHNHGLLQVNDRPKWYTVAGGARQYVDRIAAGLPAIRLADPVRRVSREPGSGQVLVVSDAGAARYDEVVLTCHSDQALALLADADQSERALLASVRYQRNRALLHTDARLMPLSRAVWSSWNYLSDGGEDPQVAVTYLLNKLQPLPVTTPLLLSLNPLLEPRAETVLGEFDYAHPVFDSAAIAAQRVLPEVQGMRQVWFAGAWTGYGFHEDGLKSALDVAVAIREMRDRTTRRAA